MTIKNYFGACLALFLGLTLGARAAIPPAEKLLPSDTLFLYTAPDIDTVRAAMKGSPNWLFWNDPAMKPFHDKFMAKWNETLIAPFEQNLGIKVDDFTAMLKGQFTFAVTQNGWKGDDSADPGILLLLDVKDKSDLLKSTLTKLQKKWTDDGKSIRTETVRGVDFTVVPLSTNDLAQILPHREPVHELGKPDEVAKPGQVVVGQYQSLLIVGSSLSAVEPVMAHLTGGSAPALSDNAVFTSDQGSQFRDAPLYYGWFNAKTVFGVFASLPDPQPNPDAPTMVPPISVKSALTASGLTGIKSVSFSYRESHDGSQLNMFVSAPESTRQGLVKILSASTKDAGPPTFVPDSVVKFSRWRIDLQKAWAELLKTVAGISPSYYGYFNAGIDAANGMAQQKTPNFDLRRDLIGNLGDDVITYQEPPVGKELNDLANPPTLFLLGAGNADSALAALRSIMTIMNPTADAADNRDFLGHKIYSLNLPSQRTSATAAPPARTLYYTAASGYMALSMDQSILEEYLRSADGKTAPLRAKPGLIEAAQHVGGTGGGLFSYQDQRASMRITFGALKAAGGNGGLVIPTALPPVFREWFDFTLLPDYEPVSKYFSFTVFGGNVSAEGLTFKVYVPRPPQLN
jgi:hypothetical protein